MRIRRLLVVLAAIAAASALAVACSGGGKPAAEPEPVPINAPDAAAAVDPGQNSGSGSAGVDLGSNLSTGLGSDAGAGSGSAVAAPPPPDPVVAGDWFDSLSRDEKLAHMKDHVMPTMAAEFKAFDPKEFKKFDCKTCHGKGASTKKFEMPNPSLPKLDFAELEAGKHKRYAEFMAAVVVPKMAELLKTKPRTPEDPNGFGCLDCHLQKQ